MDEAAPQPRLLKRFFRSAAIYVVFPVAFGAITLPTFILHPAILTGVLLLLSVGFGLLLALIVKSSLSIEA